MRRITAFHHPGRRGCSSVIIHDHRIFLGRIKMRREIEAAVNRIPLGGNEIQSCTSPKVTSLKISLERSIKQEEASFFKL